MQGEREVASGNKSLGRFDLSNIPPALRGQPQIDVTFDIDANGIFNVSAKDKVTGREQSIIIKASSGLSDKEVEQMVHDAEAHADEDRKFHEIVGIRNQADALIHATEKSLLDLCDKVNVDEKVSIEAALEDLRVAAKGEDKNNIETKITVLTEASAAMSKQAYDENAKDGAPTKNSRSKAEDDVVDAEFEEVDDDKK